MGSDQLAGSSCPGCNEMIDYVRSSEERGTDPDHEDTTEQTTLLTDGGVVENVMVRSDCCRCDDGGTVRPMPEAGYATCVDCGERGYWRDDGTEWWRNDPESQWYVEPGTERETQEESS